MFRRAAGIWAKIAGAHRSDDETGAGVVTEFFLPRLNRGFFLRMLAVTLLAAVVFGFVLIPCVINGESMVPTYPAKGFTFCWRGKYLFGKPKRGDVVILRYADRVYFLKRIVGLPGDTIEFRNGTLYVNGKAQEEPYVRYISDWNLPPRKVEPNHYYVVGDNRSQPMEQHRFGQVLSSKIAGSPLF